ncbi:MAG: cyclophilin-like family protein [Haloferacaceae archaeon]
MSDLRLTVGDVELEASWTDENPETRDAIAAALPLGGEASKWGDELYVRVPIDVPAEEAREVVDPGAVAYWPRGNALCLFWGPTPASTDGRPRAASPVNVVATAADVTPLESVRGGAHLRVVEA